ncbi:hypothetical protein GUITHDRAFT_73008, partial [Guillardia theta CCMP2712]
MSFETLVQCCRRRFSEWVKVTKNWSKSPRRVYCKPKNGGAKQVDAALKIPSGEHHCLSSSLPSSSTSSSRSTPVDFGRQSEEENIAVSLVAGHKGIEEQDFASASQGMAEDFLLEEFLGDSKGLDLFFDDVLPHVGWDVPKPAKKPSQKQPAGPKRPQPAFFHYCNAVRDQVKLENPSCSFGELSKLIGKKWSELPAADKVKYVDMEEKDRERYSAEMK